MRQTVRPSAGPRMFTLRAESNPVGKYYGLLLFSVFWSGISGFIFLKSDKDFMSFLCPGAFFLIGVVLFIVGITGIVMRGMVRRRVLPAVVQVSRLPLRMGETFRVTFAQEFVRPIDVERVCVRLYAEEWVQYRKGTSTYTDTHKLHETEQVVCEAVQGQPGRPLAGECAFTIPVESMHSFAAADNKFRWWLDVQTCLRGCPDDKLRFEIQVSPRLLPEPPAEEAE